MHRDLEGACIGEDELLRFVDGSVTGDRQAAIRAHVDVCDDCRELLAIAGREAAAQGDDDAHDAPIRDSPVALGETIEGRFLIEREIGRGGMGVVYAAKHLAMNRSVAVKVMGEGLAKDDDAVRRFLRESRIASKLESPNVATVFDIGRLPSGAPFMVMELLDGENLELLVRRSGPLDVEQAVAWVVQACHALGEAHAESITHRDVKLENIFLVQASPAPIVKVLDFGLATGGRTAVAEASLTRSNSMMGTPRYMAPEQVASARDVDARTDVWALGVCLYRLVTGKYPYDAPHFAALCVKIATASPKKPSRWRADLQPAVEDVILRCLSREPEKRYPDARALGAALTKALALHALAGDPRTPFASTQMPIAPIAPMAPIATENTRSQAPPFLEGNALVRPGEIIAGKYRVDRLLGVGGMGIVVAVTHLELGELYAMKFLHPNLASDPETIARFMREAQAAARINSELIVRLNDVGKLADGSPYIVMEHLVGEDLARRLASTGPMPVAQAVDYVLQACAGVAEAHAIGIVHRDLKPSNLFLTKRLDGSPLLKVLDFGIAKALTDAGSPSLTQTREVFGSPAYMSPEQIRSSKSVDGRTDVWALGIILHELLTGSLPFEGTTPAALLAAVSADTPRSTRGTRPDVSEALDNVVRRCLEKSPDARFQSVAELARALERFGSGDCTSLVRRFAGSSPDLLAPSLAAASPVASAPVLHVASAAPFVADDRSAAAPPAKSKWPVVAFAVLAAVLGLAVTSIYVLRGRHAPPAGPLTATAESTTPPSVAESSAASAALPVEAPPPVSASSASSSVPSRPNPIAPATRLGQRAAGGGAKPPAQPTASSSSAKPANDPWSTSH